MLSGVGWIRLPSLRTTGVSVVLRVDIERGNPEDKVYTGTGHKLV